MEFLGKKENWEAGMSSIQQIFILHLKAPGIVINVEIYI